MDVRCPQCETEYELDEGKLRPGGITVKCAQCEHVFRVRKRRPTHSGTPPVPMRRPPSVVPPSDDDDEQRWLVRLRDGEIKTCRELATLQRWIVSGRVGRDCAISRTGKKWKDLGDIPELDPFFAIADEAYLVATGQQAVPMANSPRVEGSVMVVNPLLAGPAVVAQMTSGHDVRGGAPALPRPSTDYEPTRIQPAPVDEEMTTQALSASYKFEAEPGRQVVDGSLTGVEEPAEDSARWSANPPRWVEPGPAGPTGGLAFDPQEDAAEFAHGKRHPGEFRNGRFVATDEILGDEPDLEDLLDSPGRAGAWIAGVSALVIAGACAAVYFLYLRGSDARFVVSVDAGSTFTSLPVDAGVAVTATPKPEIVDNVKNDASERIAAAIRGVNEQELVGIAARLAEEGGATAPQLTQRAQVANALSQLALSQAQLAVDETQIRTHKKEAILRADEASALASDALKIAVEDPNALLAMADAMRLRNAPAKDVSRWLRRAQKAGADSREASLVAALLLARDNKYRDARVALQQVPRAEDDFRPALSLALVETHEESWDGARQAVDRVLAVEANHPVASLLAQRLAEATGATPDPMPPEVGQDAGVPAAPTERADDYNGLIERGDSAAESGDCTAASRLYERALDARPAGVEALTGLGYCHLDSGNYSSAQARFRAALGMSSRYQDALWGMAEAYQMEGNTEQAIAAYQRFVDNHPNTSRSDAARRHIQRLSSRGDDSEPAAEGGKQAPEATPPLDLRTAPNGTRTPVQDRLE